MKQRLASRLPLLAVTLVSLTLAAASTGGLARATVRPAFLPPCPGAHPRPCVRFTPTPVYWSSASSPAIHRLYIDVSDVTNPVVIKWLNGAGSGIGAPVSYPITQTKILLKWNAAGMVSVRGVSPLTPPTAAPAAAKGAKSTLTGTGYYGAFKAYSWGSGPTTAAGPPTLRTNFRFSMS